MKKYYVEFSNGDCDFIKATSDNKAYTKACKKAKELCTSVKDLRSCEM